MRSLLLGGLALLAACTEASDNYTAREVAEEAPSRPSEPLLSPDTEGAVWAPSDENRIVYGQPGQAPYMTLACEPGDDGREKIQIERLVAADQDAKAVLALIGNGHVVRLFVDAEALETGGTAQQRWVGRYRPDEADLDVLTGRGRIEATIPGAGSLILNPSSLPGDIIAKCRGRSSPPAPESPE